MNVMKRLNIKAIAATLVATVALSVLLASCQGRTMHNVVPTGDTVEVNPMPQPEPADSI